MLGRALVRLRHGLPAGQGLAGLMSARQHGADVTLIRATVIGQRVYVAALLCVLLTLLWGVIDILAFPASLWQPLVASRLVVAAGFALIAYRRWDDYGLGGALWGLAALLGLSLALFVFGLWTLALAPAADLRSPLVIAYLYMPFVVMIGLAVFPLTAADCLRLGGGLLLAFGMAVAPIGYLGSPLVGGGEATALIWLQFIMTLIASVAGLSQLHFLLAFTEHSTRDALTGLFTRGFGDETLALQLSAAQRGGTPFAVLFLDLDRFKEVNDFYGHDAGDEVLRAAADGIAAVLRRQDTAIRWGGEEFLVLLPNTGVDGADMVARRLGAEGLGARPDGAPQTASVGLAERQADGIDDAAQLIELVDGRMYAAKDAGRNRLVGPDGAARPFIPASPRVARLTKVS
jgi:diguanylate cyclase (GGDEF)-like protein